LYPALERNAALCRSRNREAMPALPTRVVKIGGRWRRYDMRQPAIGGWEWQNQNQFDAHLEKAVQCARSHRVKGTDLAPG
jgi:hypothetical protein